MTYRKKSVLSAPIEDPVHGGLSEDIQDEILANLFGAIVGEMGWIVLRSAHTTFVKETRDFGTALLTTSGEVFSFPDELATLSNSNVPMKKLIESAEHWEQGDVLIANDPFFTEGVVTHLPDYMVIRPIFVEKEIIAFSWAFIHASDVGGSTPGSINLSNQEVFQEGTRIRPVKLYSKGRRNEDIWNVLLDNSRIPELIAGDLSALFAAIEVGEQRLLRLVDKYGVANVKRAIANTLDRSEQRTRAVFREIPKGEYTFVDYIEEDFISDLPVRIELKLKSDGDGQLELDFSGTDPQVRSAINIVIGGNRHHSILAIALLRLVMTRLEGFHLNAGFIRCITLTVPEGTILNAVFPAATGMRFTTVARVHDVILGAMNQALPGSVPAGGASEVVITSISTSHVGGKARVVVANPLMGGSGGGPHLDGMTACDFPTAFLRSVPVEVLETEADALVPRFAVIPDSEGPGKFRGGFGVNFEIETMDPEAMVILRGKERQKFEPWGFAGGQSAGVGSSLIKFNGNVVADLKKETICRLLPGQVISSSSPGGAGYGDPLERDPALVLNDCLDGLVSVERARTVYGVVVSRDRLDLTQTDRLRTAMRKLVSDGADPFDRGSNRSYWEARWGVASGRLARLLQTAPLRFRQDLKLIAFAKLKEVGQGPFSIEQVNTAWNKALEAAHLA